VDPRRWINARSLIDRRSTCHPFPAMSNPSDFPRTQSTGSSGLSIYIFNALILSGSLCGSGPFPFSIVVASTFGGTYLLRFLRDDIIAQPLSTAILLLLAYYILLGAYKLFIYNRHLDPLLAIPGPRVLPPTSLMQGHWLIGVSQIIRELNVLSTSKPMVDRSPATTMG
jgi:hypothetical protein